jgi:hypothetical protein
MIDGRFNPRKRIVHDAHLHFHDPTPLEPPKPKPRGKHSIPLKFTAYEDMSDGFLMDKVKSIRQLDCTCQECLETVCELKRRNENNILSSLIKYLSGLR